jgi:predicted Zn-dependent protease with MMP-like domain
MILRRETLEDILERLEELYGKGETAEAEKELRRARRLHPEDLVLLEWEATFASDQGRYPEALKWLEKVLSTEPDRPFARREKALALLGLGRFEEALSLLEEIGPDNAGDARYHFDRGLCLDRLGRLEDADQAFRKAARLDPETFPAPPRLTADEFDGLVRGAVEEVPPALKPYLENVMVEVMDYPRTPPLEAGLDLGLLGLYSGVPRTERTQELRDHLDRIFIFKRNLELEFPTRKELAEEIRKTVIHEIAHHFGLGEAEMGEYA